MRRLFYWLLDIIPCEQCGVMLSRDDANYCYLSNHSPLGCRISDLSLTEVAYCSNCNPDWDFKWLQGVDKNMFTKHYAKITGCD